MVHILGVTSLVEGLLGPFTTMGRNLIGGEALRALLIGTLFTLVALPAAVFLVGVPLLPAGSIPMEVGLSFLAPLLARWPLAASTRDYPKGLQALAADRIAARNQRSLPAS